jgi:hypothetical protein
MSDSANGNPLGTAGSEARPFRLPALDVAAAEFQAQQTRAMRGPIGCLLILTGGAVVATFLFFLDAGGRVFLWGLAALVVGFILTRAGLGIVPAWAAALGAGAATAGAMAWWGIEAAWPYWILAGLLGLLGVLVAGTDSKVSTGFIRARNASVHSGCRIGLFRPFHSDYSAQAKNLLLPLLRGYGPVFFVEDESFTESGFTGLWSKDYQALPGIVGGHRYTDEEWQKQVQAQLDDVDVAVVDISAPSANVVWEIKQCYDRLPSHRILFVASANVLPTGLPTDAQDQSFQAAIWAHLEPILRGLKELGANPKTRPVCLIYSTDVKGQVWLASALFHAMSNIVALEAGAPQPGE